MVGLKKGLWKRLYIKYYCLYFLLLLGGSLLWLLSGNLLFGSSFSRGFLSRLLGGLCLLRGSSFFRGSSLLGLDNLFGLFGSWLLLCLDGLGGLWLLGELE